MAGKIINAQQAFKIANELRQQRKTIVLVGGCFDILHAGHLTFLEKAYQKGDILFVLLESDENIRIKKGEKRPLNNQKVRANILSTYPFINYIICLKGVTNDAEYDRLMVQIKPDIIVMTAGDSNTKKRQKQCEMIGAKLKFVDRILAPSTTDLISKNS